MLVAVWKDDQTDRAVGTCHDTQSQRQEVASRLLAIEVNIMGTVRRYSLGRSHALCFSLVATRWKGTSQTQALYRHLYTRAKAVNGGDDAAKLKIQGSDTGARRRTQPQMHTLTDPALQATTGVNVFLGLRASSIFHRLRWQRSVP